MRLVRPEDLPESLWRAKDGCIVLAPDVVRAWRYLLGYAGLMAKAMEHGESDIVGGVGEEETNHHLARRFSGSAARVQLAMLDPLEKLPGVSDAFARVFSGGTVLVADLPCGSGAAILAILSTIAELRRREVVPREPLHVKIVGGELSEFARNYASIAAGEIIAALEEQAIRVSAEFIEWDALDRFSTATFIKKLTLMGTDCSARMIVLANFSGFLQHGGKWKKAAPQFTDLFVHSRDRHSSVIWIEPQTNEVVASGGFFGRVLDWFRMTFSPIHKDEALVDLQVANLGLCDAKVQHPLRDDHQFRVNLSIQRFDLPCDEVDA